MFRHNKLLAALFALFCVFAAACGSTVPVEQQQLAEAQAGEDLDGDLSGGIPEGATINDRGQVVNAEGEVIGSAEDFGISNGGGGGDGTASTGETSTSGGGGSKPVAAGDNGPGITGDTIKIGVSYADDAEEANQAIGATGASQINQRRAWEAMLKYINDHGGVNGRKLVPVFHKLSATSTEPYDQQDQEVCAHWSQDDPVFVSDGAFKTENGISCFQENGMVTITTNGLRFKSRSFFERYPTYLEFDGVDNDSIALMYADSMKTLKFFDKGYKLGIITWDDREYAEPTRDTLVPRLKQHGIKVSDVTYIQTPDSGGQIGDAVAQIGNTAVRYKGEGITHVMFMDLGANIALFFGQAAEKQQYRPRYGLTSASGNSALVTAVPNQEDDWRRQLRRAVSIGWLPTIDVREADMPGWAVSPRMKVCYQQMREGGVEMTSGNARALAAGVCDAAWTIQATLEAAGPVINQETWYRGLSRADVELTGSMGFQISPSKRDGLELAARMKFYTDCACFKYISERFRIPE